MDTNTVLTALLVLAGWLAVDILVGPLVGLLLSSHASGLTASASRAQATGDISPAG